MMASAPRDGQGCGFVHGSAHSYHLF
jgi:hypothetical protein